MLKLDFTLEIYEPEDDRCVAAAFHSDKPFMSIRKGDLINSTMFPEAGFHGILEVTSIEHIIWEIENSHQTHKICVRTKKSNL